MNLFYYLVSSEAYQKELPSVSTCIYQLVIAGLIEEILFYSIHRIMHITVFYQQVHKLHHKFTAPVGMAGTYAHPLEHFLTNLLPILFGPILLKMHITLIWIWILFAQFMAITTHSGYDFYGFPSWYFDFNAVLLMIGIIAHSGQTMA